MTDWQNKKCIPCEGGVTPLTEQAITDALQSLPGWQAENNHKAISKTFSFKNYGKTMAFANAIAWLAHKEVHHPDLFITYNSCKVLYTTHAIDGLSENDLICAAKVEAITN